MIFAFRPIKADNDVSSEDPKCLIQDVYKVFGPAPCTVKKKL